MEFLQIGVRGDKVYRQHRGRKHSALHEWQGSQVSQHDEGGSLGKAFSGMAHTSQQGMYYLDPPK